MSQGYTVNDNSSDTLTKLNRMLLEDSKDQVLPEGKIYCDQAPNFSSGVEITGHKNGTIIENQRYSATYPLNCCTQILGEGIDYVNFFIRGTSKNTIICENAQKYQVGDVCYFWIWDGYTRGQQAVFIAEIVMITDTTIVLDRDIDDVPYDRVKLIHGSITEPYSAGQGFLTVKHPARFSLGQDLFLTDGPKQANEAYGRHVTVESIDKNIIYLKYPLTTDFTNPTLAVIHPKKNITLNNIRFGIPLNTGSHSFYSFLAKNIKLNNCESMYGPFALGSVNNSQFLSCYGYLSFNNSTDNIVEGGLYSGIAFEEGSYDNQIKNLTVFNPHGGQHGIYSNPYAISGRMTIRNVLIANFGVNPGNGDGCPITGYYADSLIEQLKAIHTQNSGYSFMSGDNIRVNNCDFDKFLAIVGSKNVRLTNIQSQGLLCGWYEDPNNPISSGQVFNSNNLIVANDQWELINSKRQEGLTSIKPFVAVGIPQTFMSKYRAL